ncbi:MAG TPA: PQQ-binding-like beta-propeller repeat protein [Pyrinomonadaceae bacterium]|nr:PQQ-binding-like beta-propeller repeat protein [Pyrinomonadaceae bacterium]
MFCPSHVRFSILAAVTLLLAGVQLPAQSIGSAFPPSSTAQGQSTQVHLRWGARPGILRYRLQLARDREFNDIIFDRVVSGNEYEMGDLAPGRYFWRVAALTSTLEFSSAGVIDVSPASQKPDNRADLLRPREPINTQTASPATANRVAFGDGWRALIGEVSGPVLAHLRSASALDLVAINNAGVVYALDADSGIALWSARPRTQQTGLARPGASPIAPLLVKSRTNLDNIVVLSNSTVFALDGASGRELWRTLLPAPASSGVALSGVHSSEVFIIDNSLQRLFLVDGGTGKVIAQTELPSRAFGAPVALDHEGQRGVMIAFENGRLEFRDVTGKMIRSGNAGSPATTRPLFVSGPRGGIVLLGTRSGLTAFDSDGLRALGRVALKDDTPRGTLSAADLDGDGVAEVIMLTDHGRIVAVKTADGKILWESLITNDAQSVAFADVNGDHVLDVLVAGGQTFAMALSGRDGSVVWKEDEPPALVANHAASLTPRSLIAVPHGPGILLIGSDPSRMGLRAVEFPGGTVRPLSR